MSATDAQRVANENLRTRIGLLLDKLDAQLDEQGHDRSCVLRCFNDENDHEHACALCGDDE